MMNGYNDRMLSLHKDGSSEPRKVSDEPIDVDKRRIFDLIHKCKDSELLKSILETLKSKVRAH